MKYFLLIPIFIMVFIGCDEVQLQNATEKKENMQIEKNLTKNDDIKIKPHALWDSEQNYIWNRLIEIVPKEENYDKMIEIFEIAKQTDGVTATQYSLDIFEIYKRNPIFFVKSVDKYYKSDYTYILSRWINEALDVTLEDLKKYSSDYSTDPIIIDFLTRAEALNDKLFKK